jgi:predicted nucleic acid-binding protein
MILADTSVWVDHLRKGNERLAGFLNEGVVLYHPFIIGELACGNLKNRDEILGMLAALPSMPVAEHDEVLDFISRHKFQGKGIGLIDAHLLASACLAKCRIWTLDRSLLKIANTLKVSI